jgi:hypothetical protein
VGAVALAQPPRGRRGDDPADPGVLDHQAPVGRAAPGAGRPGLAAALRPAGPGAGRLRRARRGPRRAAGPRLRPGDRRQYPLGPKVTALAFGRDRRLPITTRWREPLDVSASAEAAALAASAAPGSPAEITTESTEQS